MDRVEKGRVGLRRPVDVVLEQQMNMLLASTDMQYGGRLCVQWVIRYSSLLKYVPCLHDNDKSRTENTERTNERDAGPTPMYNK